MNTTPIRNYQDLVLEKERLRALLSLQKDALRDDIDAIKEALSPAQTMISFASKLFMRDGSNILLNSSANTLIDLVMKKFILARTGWVTRIVVPFLMKNLSSHFIADNKDAFLNKLFSWIGKKNANGKKTYAGDTNEDDYDMNGAG